MIALFALRPDGNKQLETALVGLDTVHEIQLKFAAKAEELLAEGGRAGARPSRDGGDGARTDLTERRCIN